MPLLKYFIVSFLEFFVDTFTTIVIGKFDQFRVNFVLEFYDPHPLLTAATARPCLQCTYHCNAACILYSVSYVQHYFIIIVISLTYFVCSVVYIE